METTNQQQEPPELSQSDLTGLVSSLESSLSEVDVELFNQLGCSLELDTFLTDFAGVEVKVGEKTKFPRFPIIFF